MNLTDLEKAMHEAFDAMQGKIRGQDAMLLELAQKMGHKPIGNGGGNLTPSHVADVIQKSAEFQALCAGRVREVVVPIEGGLQLKNTVVNASGASQPLVPADRLPGIIGTALQPLRLRDVIPANTTQSNSVEFAQLSAYTSNARPQGDASPGGVEGEAFAESAMTFALSSAAVVTIGHWLGASQQVLADAQVLADFIQTYLLYGLKLEEEHEILTGDGTAGKINGINNQAALFTGGATNQTLLDTLSKAKLQLANSNFVADAVILHPNDFQTLESLKDSQNRYLLSDPAAATQPRVWGIPIIVSPSQTAGKFTMGAFAQAARIWDRQEAAVEFSTGYQDYFVRHLVAIKAWERVTLTVYRPTAIIYGSTSYAG